MRGHQRDIGMEFEQTIHEVLELLLRDECGKLIVGQNILEQGLEAGTHFLPDAALLETDVVEEANDCSESFCIRRRGLDMRVESEQHVEERAAAGEYVIDEMRVFITDVADQLGSFQCGRLSMGAAALFRLLSDGGLKFGKELRVGDEAGNGGHISPLPGLRVPSVEKQVEGAEVFVTVLGRGGQLLEHVPGGLGLIVLELPEQVGDE